MHIHTQTLTHKRVRCHRKRNHMGECTRLRVACRRSAYDRVDPYRDPYARSAYGGYAAYPDDRVDSYAYSRYDD
eukprot:scaffold42862_cov23-Tisochrysis_lutea.AAC.3